MLINHISNPWVRFKVLFATLQEEKEKIRMAKNAFLYVIANYNAFKFQKSKALNDIAGTYPNIVKMVCDKEILRHFRHFYNKMSRRKEIVTPSELDWVNRYVKDADIRTNIERSIYCVLLGASSYWNGVRQGFHWTISEKDKLELAREVLQIENLGSKRRMELAQEFGEPCEKFVNDYHRKLLRDKHYNQAEVLEVNDPDLFIDAIISNINNGRFGDALYIAQRFLPDREDIMKEIQQIIAIFRT